MKIQVIICLLLISISGCVSQKSIGAGQGISGEVRWLEGNLMPTIGDTSYVARAEGTPVQREVFIYEAVRRDNTVTEDGTFFETVSSKLVKKVKTDSEGRFRVILPIGQYSVFVLEKGGLYANTFDGENYINPVTVEPGKFAEIKISINYKAYY